MKSDLKNDYYCDFSYKFFNDPIYGGIGLSKFEVDLVSKPVFQRLRNIRQLGFLNYVFPSAEHSRFVHSLGVLHIMGKITGHLKERGDISLKDQIKLRLAALLHDIGHYPFSHLGENVYSYYEDKSSEILMENGTNKNSLLSELGEKIKNKAHHEQLSKYIIKNNEQISNELIDAGIDPNEIGAIVTGEIGVDNLIYSQLMHSSLDADRLDYLVRDSSRTGVKYGLVDLDYIFRLFQVIDNYKLKYEKEEHEVSTLACNSKGQHVIEHYLMSRYFHYSQVISHKTSLAFEGIAKVLFYKLINNNEFIFNSYQEILDNVNNEKFLNFTDDTLFEYLKKYYNKTNDMDYKIFYRHLRDRKRPKTLIEVKTLFNKHRDMPPNKKYYDLEKFLERTPEKLSEIIGVPSEHIGYYKVSVAVESIPSYMTIDESNKELDEKLREAVKLVSKKGEKKEVEFLASDNNSLINKLTDFQNKVLRVFYIEPKNEDKETRNNRWKNARKRLLEKIK